MKDKVRAGIVGFGIMGELYGDALTSFGDSELAAIAEPSPLRRECASGKYPCPVYESYEEMFAKTEMDLAIVAVPDFAHKEPVLAAARAGVNLLVEKPFATTVEDAEEMARAVEAAGVKCSVEFSNRWSIQFAKAREWVQEGQLGRLVHVTADLNDTFFVPTEMLSWAGKTTPAWFLMSHTADLIAWITEKKPVRVFARGTRQLLVERHIDTYDVIEALVEYEGGITGRLTSGWVLPKGFPIIYEFKMRLIGSEAGIDIDLSDQSMHFFGHERYEHPSNAVGKVHGRYVGGIYNMLRGYLRNIREDTPPLVTHRDGVENTRFLAAVHQSLEIGQLVTV